VRRLVLCLWAAAAAQEGSPPVPSGEIDREHARQLLAVRRVYVDRLGGGNVAAHIRDMLIAALHRTRLFIVTEDEERADAFLRGSAEDLIFSETRSSREELRAGGIAVTDGNYSRERKHEAAAALRLVARDGDVLWSTTQESRGAKYRGSSADVAEKVAKELAAAYSRAKKLLK